MEWLKEAPAQTSEHSQAVTTTTTTTTAAAAVDESVEDCPSFEGRAAQRAPSFHVPTQLWFPGEAGTAAARWGRSDGGEARGRGEHDPQARTRDGVAVQCCIAELDSATVPSHISGERELVRRSLVQQPAMVYAAIETRKGMAPEFLYSAKAATSRSGGASPSALFQALTTEGAISNAAPVFTATSLFKQVAGAARTPAGVAPSFVVPAPSEGKIIMFSPEYYRACAFGGALCCGLTHMGVTPIDVVKCNMQIAPAKYKSIAGGFSLVVKEQGALGLFRGWVPTLLGYSVQGTCKYGFYEYFKKTYSDLAGPENSKKYKTLIYLAGSASAEVIADVGLCPFEAVKVRVQTNPGFAKGLSDGLPKLIASDGIGGLYKGLVPLWGRQIPYTMMKFATFESTVEAIYKYAVPVPKSEVSSSTQLGISFTAGYIAGVACAIISHPADNLVSFLNNAKGATVSQAVEQMGLKALFTRGLPLRIIMVGTLTGAQWGIYDAFKVFVGLPTTGGVVEEPKKLA